MFKKLPTKNGLQLKPKPEKRIVSSKEDYICPYCKNVLPNKYRLKRHIESAHSSGEKIGKSKVKGIVCPHCSVLLSRRSTLNRHIEQVHLNLQIFQPAKCMECDKVRFFFVCKNSSVPDAEELVFFSVLDLASCALASCGLTYFCFIRDFPQSLRT